MSVNNILIVGVGGQGTLLASKVLGSLAMEEGVEVKVSELHGMSQRGGSVVTHVRFGKGVSAPLIDEGCADYIVAFEKLEAARYINYIKPNGVIIVNDMEILPMPVIMGVAEYPQNIMQILKDNAKDVFCIDATKIATECGSLRSLNVVLLGVLAKSMDISEKSWETALKKTIKPAFLDVNIEAFNKGKALKI